MCHPSLGISHLQVCTWLSVHARGFDLTSNRNKYGELDPPTVITSPCRSSVRPPARLPPTGVPATIVPRALPRSTTKH